MTAYRSSLLIVLVCLLTACGSSPSAPSSSAPPPSATAYNLTGQVNNSTTSAGIGGATVMIVDGPNAGQSASTNSGGAYSFNGLKQSGFTARATALYYVQSSVGVSLTANQTANFALDPIPLFSRSGSGNTVFDMPTTVARVHIRGEYTGYGSNFIVHIGGQHIVNDLIGTAFGPTVSDGTYLTTGGIVEIIDSLGVAWTFTEVRP